MQEKEIIYVEIVNNNSNKLNLNKMINSAVLGAIGTLIGLIINSFLGR
ncbi:MAG: hypothetical protein FWF59_11705 [Turicibacter sp.]|nr:hypothetical protein [Turicibacter sp.]